MTLDLRLSLQEIVM